MAKEQLDRIEVADSERCILGECALWDHRSQSFFWVDGLKAAIHRLDPSGRKTSWPWPDEIGSLGLAAGGKLVAAGRSGFFLFDPATGGATPLVNPETDRPRNRLNDGKVDRRGRFWAGSLQEGDYAPRGRLWKLETGAKVSLMLEGLTCPNAISWSPDGKVMYFTDSFSGIIEQFDYDIDDGVAYRRREFARIPAGRGVGDGACVDADGCLWNANINGWCVTRYDPTGRIDRILSLPARRPTSCTFGGPNLDTLYITTATRRMAEWELAQQPVAGCLLAVKVGAKGLPEPEFI